MSKRPTPKKKASHAQTYRRYKIFQGKTQKRLAAMTALAVCPQCKERRPAHAACPQCGTYNGRPALNMNKKIDKITKVKA